MTKPNSIRLTFTLLITLIGSVSVAHSATITINAGSTLIMSGGKLDLDCKDVTVRLNSGGTLSVTGGEIEDLNLKRVGGTYSKSGGKVTECDGFYIIVTPNGAAIINL